MLEGSRSRGWLQSRQRSNGVTCDIDIEKPPLLKSISSGTIFLLFYRFEKFVEVASFVQGMTIMINPDRGSQHWLVAAPTN
jgi:hypothetical protein